MEHGTTSRKLLQMKLKPAMKAHVLPMLSHVRSQGCKMTVYNAIPQVSLHYQQVPGKQVEETAALRQPVPLEGLQPFQGLGFSLDKLGERLQSGLHMQQKVTELEARQKTLENIVSVLSRELGRRDKNPSDVLSDTMAKILYLEEKVEQQESLLTLKDVMINSLASRIHLLEQTSYDGRFLWKVQEVGLRTQEAQTGSRPAIYSPPFYTSRYGYKLCLKLFLNGDGTGAGSHLSLFLVLMKGEYDFQLTWPFRHKGSKMALTLEGTYKSPHDLDKGNEFVVGASFHIRVKMQQLSPFQNVTPQVTFTLLDQVKKHHVSTSFRPLESSSSFQRPVSETNVASGLPEFCPLTLLHNLRTGYICNDTLVIQAVIDPKV